MPCPSCKTRRLVVIDMRVGGQMVRMASCSSCDARWWEGTDGALPLHDVLSLVASRS
jgi:transcriptional regulator NrdR family protein